MISGKLTMEGGPKYEYISDGTKVIVTGYAHGTLQKCVTLDKTNATETLYTGNGVGDFQADVSLEISGSTFTLKYDVEFFGQSSSPHKKGILCSWETGD